MLTLEQLQKIMPNVHNPLVNLPFLNKAMEEGGINTYWRMCAFLAQIAHESGELRWLEELWGPTPQQLKYDPPSELAKELGNTEVGDGHKYKGRGVLQITGKFNYEKAGIALHLDLINNHELAAQPSVAFRIGTWFWNLRKLSELADQGPAIFEQITHKINGGLNGQEQRLKYFARAQEVLKVLASS